MSTIRVGTMIFHKDIVHVWRWAGEVCVTMCVVNCTLPYCVAACIARNFFFFWTFFAWHWTTGKWSGIRHAHTHTIQLEYKQLMHAHWLTRIYLGHTKAESVLSHTQTQQKCRFLAIWSNRKQSSDRANRLVINNLLAPARQRTTEQKQKHKSINLVSEVSMRLVRTHWCALCNATETKWRRLMHRILM